MKISDHLILAEFKVIIVFILFLLFSFLVNAQESKKTHPFADKLVFSASGGISMLGTRDFENIPNYNFSGSIEYFFRKNSLSILGIKLFGMKGYLSGEYDSYPVPTQPDLYPKEFITEFNSYGGGFTYQYHFSNYFSPNIFVGASYLYFDPKDKNGDLLPGNAENSYKKEGISYIVEAGLRFFFSSNFSVNLKTGLNITDSDMLDDVMVGEYKDWIYYANIGFSFALFGGNDKDEQIKNKTKATTNIIADKQTEIISIHKIENKPKTTIITLSERYSDIKFKLSDDGYAIQVLYTDDRMEAENELFWLQKNNYKSFITEYTVNKTNIIKYALRIGYFETFDETYNYFYGEN